MLVPILNIFAIFYLSYSLAKRVGYDIGAMLGLVFFPFITLPWLGLKVQKKKTTFAWVV